MQLYIILEWTPVPGYFCPLHSSSIQAAEFALGLNKTYYNEKAFRHGDELAYPFEVAMEIVNYWIQRYPFAMYRLQQKECTQWETIKDGQWTKVRKRK